MNFDEVKVKTMALNADPAFRAVLEKHGFFLAQGRAVGCSYKTPTNVTLNIGTSTMSAADANELHTKAWLEQGVVYGLKPEWLDKVIDYGGKFYRMEGLDFTNRQGYYVKSKRVKDGKVFWLDHRAVVRIMEGKGR